MALLACLPGERHELGLMAFGLALRSHGWRIAFLGSDTPLDTVDEAADALQPSLVVFSTVTSDLVHAALPQLQTLASRYRVALGGAGRSASTRRISCSSLRATRSLEAGRVHWARGRDRPGGLGLERRAIGRSLPCALASQLVHD